jgi:alpha-D-ribose 1-methylphosphonate 5-triphosphate diphosphatase
MQIHITGGQVLTRDSGLTKCALGFEEGCIAIDPSAPSGARLDASGLLVLPGIVDLHGDAFERQMQPRPGVDFPLALALRDTEAQLLANGITTAFHGVTLSWEPGLRSAASWSALLDALDAQTWVCDMRVHLRWEAFNLDALEMALADIARGRVHLLAFNDHTPSILRRLGNPETGAKYHERAGMTAQAFRALADRVASREAEVPDALLRIAAAARKAGLPMASHDDDTEATRNQFRELGARICEFPMSEQVGIGAREAGDAVLMGSPNVVRGGSHLGWASAAKMAEAGICSVLSSDYFYPAMLGAGLALAKRGALDFAAAWSLISHNPAAAAGLADRGAIAEGLRGDVIVVDPARQAVVATIVAGQIAYVTAEGARRVRSS